MLYLESSSNSNNSPWKKLLHFCKFPALSILFSAGSAMFKIMDKATRAPSKI